MSPSRVTVLLGATCAVLAIESTAVRAEPARHHHRVSPAVYGWFEHAGYRNHQGRRMANGPDPRRAPVTVRVTHPADLDRLRALDGAELALTHNGRALSRLGPIVSATVTRAGLDLLLAEPSVRRVELDVVPPYDPPLDETARQIGATDAWLTHDAASLPLTGAGIVIADIDSGIDVFHPLMFRATDRYYAWIDADDDGVFEPGVDRIALGDGTTPVVGYFEGVAYSLGGGLSPILGTDDGVFEAGLDHLFVDANGDGQRNYGPSEGFTEDDPTYGELLVLADDVNGNGQLDVGEKLVALGESKVRAVYDTVTEYKRGADLIGTPGHDDPWAFHGAGVSAILVGGNRGLTRLVGIAPDAEVVLGAFQMADALSPLLTWAVQQDADVILHEYAPWVGHHKDGSSNQELLMDEASAAGAVNVNPSGNLGGARKHARVDLAPRGALTVPLAVPASGYQYVQITALWRQTDRELEVVLEAPGGASVNLGTSGASTSFDGVEVYSYRDDSARGTAMFDIVLWTSSGTIPSGEWTIGLADNGATDLAAPAAELSLYVADELSGWGEGVAFPRYTSEQHLIGFPATADSAITVAAYAGRGAAPYNFGSEAQGELRRYSCRGSRIDGVEIMDVAAPDNPLSATNAADYGGSYVYPHGSYRVFGGTSGAGPHVAGTAALIKQLQPELTGSQVRDAIRAGAIVDDDVTGVGDTPREQLWGAGKLNTYRALYGAEAPVNTPPTVAVAPIEAPVDQPVTLAITAADAEDGADALRLELDTDYDGDYDIGPLASDELPPVTFATPGTHYLKVRVTDTGGMSGAALARVDVSETCADCEQEPEDAGGCGCRHAPTGGHGLAAGLLALCALVALRRRARR